MASLTINDNLVEPAAQCEGGHQYEPDASNSKYLLVQFKHSLDSEEHAELVHRKISLQQYIGAETYICYYDPADLSSIRDLDFVEYANVYHPDLVIQDNLKSKCDRQSSSELQPSPGDFSAKETAEDATVFTINVWLHQEPERDISQLKQALVNDLPFDPAKVKIVDGHLVISDVSPSNLRRIASYDEVKRIEEQSHPIHHNHVARGDLDFVDYTALDPGIDRADYDAEKILVAIGDTGFDLGSLTDQHPAFKEKRVLYLVNENNDHPTNEDQWGHGTHTCGSIAANHESTQFGLIRGTAPAANIFFQPMAYINPDPSTGADRSGKLISPNFQKFWEDPPKKKAFIHSNSYGLNLDPDPSDKNKRIQRSYDDGGVAEIVDNFMKSNEESLVIFSAGNEGEWAPYTDTGATIGGYAASKNCLTVGACETSKRFENMPPNGPFYCYNSKGAEQGSKNNVALFSSIGPTKNTLDAANNNSRIKPDVVAPGTIIYSAKSRYKPLLWRYDNTTQKPLSEDYDGISTDKLWAFLSGTSMATPLVSGCAAVLRKVLLKSATPGSKIPGALIKALLVNGAVDMKESHQSRGPDLKSPPDNSQGFGRVSITASLRNITDHVHCGYIPVAGPVAPLAKGKSTSYPINIPKAPKDGLQIVLKATMCYNDPGGTSTIINVLNLKATQDQGNPGSPDIKTKYGNTQNDKPDGKNNVQKVIWKGIHPGAATLVVECADLKLPNTFQNQDYALVWSIDYVDNSLSPGVIALISALSVVALAAIITVIAVEAPHHH